MASRVAPDGLVQDSVICRSPPVSVGAAALGVAVAVGVPVAVADQAPSPPLVLAVTRIVYGVSLVRPEIVAEVVVEVFCRSELNGWLPDFHCTL